MWGLKRNLDRNADDISNDGVDWVFVTMERRSLSTLVGLGLDGSKGMDPP